MNLNNNFIPLLTLNQVARQVTEMSRAGVYYHRSKLRPDAISGTGQPLFRSDRLDELKAALLTEAVLQNVTPDGVEISA